MQVLSTKVYSVSYLVSYLNKDDEHVDIVDCILELDLTESKQNIKFNTKISCAMNDRKYISDFNAHSIIADPPSCIQQNYLYDMMIYALDHDKAVLHQLDPNKRLIFHVTNEIMIYVDLIDIEFDIMRKEIAIYKEKIKRLTNGVLPNWECLLCNSIKTYIDIRCCCIHCGKIICIDCRCRLINNMLMKCPYCTNVHSGPLTC